MIYADSDLGASHRHMGHADSDPGVSHHHNVHADSASSSPPHAGPHFSVTHHSHVLPADSNPVTPAGPSEGLSKKAGEPGIAASPVAFCIWAQLLLLCCVFCCAVMLYTMSNRCGLKLSSVRL